MNFDGQKYALELAYRGAQFCGWQKQKEGPSGLKPSIQTLIEEAIQSISGEEVSVVGSGRTDAGVHALGQVAHFTLKQKDWKLYVLYRALNTKLPVDIRVQKVFKVAKEFHAQRSALQKQYSYYFQQGPGVLPHLEPYSWWIFKRLDQAAMQAALDYLVGTHDFKGFQARGAVLKNTVRTIYEAKALVEPIAFPFFEGQNGGQYHWLRLKIRGNGFLKQMVRGIAGTLLEIGENRRDPKVIKDILESGKRNLVGPTAPARALWLEKVWYPESLYLRGDE